MSNYTLKNHEDKLNHQVIHMDQAVCYCPEFRATGMMHDYPSRKLQLARAVFKDEMDASSYTKELIFQSILSRQGERWQNFGECPEDLTDVMILSREMLIKKGYGLEIVEELKKILSSNEGHILKISETMLNTWKRAIPVLENSKTYLMLDDATAFYAVDSVLKLGDFFRNRGIAFAPEIKPTFAGFEYFAYGLMDEGIAHLKAFFEKLKSQNIDVIYTLSGQVTYLMQMYADKLGLEVPFKVVSLMDEIKKLSIDQPSYFYAGSFNTRYLRNSSTLNALAINEEEMAILNCQEFTPLLKADKRINVLNIWQKPLCAEYLLLGMDQAIVEKIKKDALRDIKISGAEQIVVFEPFAYQILREALPTCKIIYYLEII